MACYYHSGVEAVAACERCGKWLCKECAVAFEPPLCRDCVIQEAQATKRKMILSIILSIFLFIVGATSFSGTLGVGSIATGFIFLGIPYGWSFLNRITPSIFIWLPWLGWIIYFLFKVIASAMIGLFVFPIKLIGWITEIRRANLLLDGVSELNGETVKKRLSVQSIMSSIESMIDKLGKHKSEKIDKIGKVPKKEYEPTKSEASSKLTTYTQPCSYCGEINKAGFRFCNSCGRPSEKPKPVVIDRHLKSSSTSMRYCAFCGTGNNINAKFCKRCGKPK